MFPASFLLNTIVANPCKCIFNQFSVLVRNPISCQTPKRTKVTRNAILIYNRSFSQTNEKVDIAENPSTRILKIAIIGTPNTGKSTFINQIVGRRVFAISSKVHTTRARARAVLTLDDTQVVFLDTPGLVTQAESEKHNLESEFLRDGELAMSEANIVGVMHDVSNPLTRGRLDPKVLRILHLYNWKHTILILNKVDMVKKKRYLLELADRLTCKKLADPTNPPFRIDCEKLSEEEVMKQVKRQTGWPKFRQVFMVSALEGSGVTEVMEYMLQFSKPGCWRFPETAYTDQKPEQIVCEAVKSKLLEHLPQEVPYNCQVDLELFNELRDGTIMAVVLITCKKQRYEKIVIKKIKTIAQESETALRNTFMTQVLVKLVVQPVEK